MWNTYAILMMVLYTFFLGHREHTSLTTGTTCTADGLRFATTLAQTMYVQGRWSLMGTYLTGAGPLRPSSFFLQVGAYLPMYPFGCILVLMNGSVFPYASDHVLIPAHTSDIRLFYNICPLLLPLFTPHLLVYLEPIRDPVTTAVGHK